MSTSFVATLRENCAMADEFGRTSLMRSVFNGDLETIAVLASFERCWADTDGYTALMHAVATKNADAVSLIVDFEYPFVLPDSRTALMLAVEHKGYSLIPLLSKRLSNLTDKHGYSALMHAVVLGDIEAIRILVESWPNIHREDLMSAKDVLELGPVESQAAIAELLNIYLERTLDFPGGRVLCTGVVPRKAIPGDLNGIYPISVHFHEQDAFRYETELQLCSTIKSLRNTIANLEAANHKERPKQVSKGVFTVQSSKEVNLQTPLIWKDGSHVMSKLMAKLDSKQRRLKAMEDELHTLQARKLEKDDMSVYYKEASQLRIKEKALKDRVQFLEQALDEHIRILNSVLGTKCQSLMDVENRIKAILQDINRKKDIEQAPSAASTCVFSPVTAIQEASRIAERIDKDTATEEHLIAASTQTVDTLHHPPPDIDTLCNIDLLQQQYVKNQSLLDKIRTLAEVVEGSDVSENMLLPVLERIIQQHRSLQSRLDLLEEDVRKRDVALTKFQSIFTQTGLSSVDALMSYISALQQDLKYYKAGMQGAASLTMSPITLVKATCTSEDSPKTISSHGSDVTTNLSEVSELLRQIASYTRRPCTTVKDAMQLIHEHYVQNMYKGAALYSVHQELQKEHTMVQSARMALSKQETSHSNLMNKHTRLINDMQLLTVNYNALGNKYNALYAENERLRSAAASSELQLSIIRPRSQRHVNFVEKDATTDGGPEPGPISASEDDNTIKVPGSITIANVTRNKVVYEVSSDKAYRIQRSMDIGEAKRIISQYLLSKKTRSQSSAGGSPLYPAWHCCTSADISKWLHKPLYLGL